MDAERRRALTIELTAVLGWVLLRRLGIYIRVPGEANWPVVDSAYSEFSSVIGGLAQLALLLYIVWNSGDDLGSFGLCRPSVRHVLSGAALGAGLFLSAILIPRAIFAHRATGWHLPYLPKEHGALALGIHGIHQIIWATFIPLFFQGLLIPRVEELSGTLEKAIAASTVAFTLFAFFDYGASGLYAGVLGGLVLGVGFASTRSLWVPAVALFILYSAGLCYG